MVFFVWMKKKNHIKTFPTHLKCVTCSYLNNIFVVIKSSLLLRFLPIQPKRFTSHSLESSLKAIELEPNPNHSGTYDFPRIYQNQNYKHKQKFPTH